MASKRKKLRQKFWSQGTYLGSLMDLTGPQVVLGFSRRVILFTFGISNISKQENPMDNFIVLEGASSAMWLTKTILCSSPCGTTLLMQGACVADVNILVKDRQKQVLLVSFSLTYCFTLTSCQNIVFSENILAYVLSLSTIQYTKIVV